MSTYDQLIEEGMIKGKIEAKKEVIIRGFKNGASIEFLSIQTDLNKTEIISILKGVNLI